MFISSVEQSVRTFYDFALIDKLITFDLNNHLQHATISKQRLHVSGGNIYIHHDIDVMPFWAVCPLGDGHES